MYFMDILPSFQRKVRKVRKKGNVFFFFDFDGTLSPIAQNPYNVKVSEYVLRTLSNLAALNNICVGIISGRELAFMKRHFKDKNIFLVGSHGSEVAYKDYSVSRDDMLIVAKRIDQKVNSYMNTISGTNGALIEAKKFGVALHYRMCLPQGKKVIRRLARKIARELPETKVTILRGKQVAEINPKIGWNKGKAILEIREHFPSKERLELYVGDDISDEYAFAELNQNNQYTVRIRRRKDSKAKYYLKTQKEVELFLELLSTDPNNFF